MQASGFSSFVSFAFFRGNKLIFGAKENDQIRNDRCQQCGLNESFLSASSRPTDEIPLAHFGDEIQRIGETHECGRRFLGLGWRGNTGVTGMARGGDLAGRLAACLARASTMKLLVIGRDSVLRDDCLKGCARMCDHHTGFEPVVNP